jgi:hypothetical protein
VPWNNHASIRAESENHSQADGAEQEIFPRFKVYYGASYLIAHRDTW